MIRIVKLVASLTIIGIMLAIGTGLTMVPAYNSGTNYLTLGTILQNQNVGPTRTITGLNSETLAKIENNSLTSSEIPKIKESLQSTLNQGFQQWTERIP